MKHYLYELLINNLTIVKYYMQMTTLTILILTSFGMLTQCNSVSNTLPVSSDANTIQVKKEEKKDTYRVSEYTKANKLEKYNTAIFAGGCFWCTEAAFERIEGVVDVISGYTGGEEEYPDYAGVGREETGHTEGIFIYYDSDVISYETLLEILWVAHDPTTLNRQGPDRGPQYRSGVYYQTVSEKALIDNSIEALQESKMYSDPVVTEVAPYKEFWVAEEYHQNFYELHPNQGYVANVSRPKVNKVVKTFPNLIKKKYKKS
jgi:peptide-methionine (S)-S-oxide reductase